MSHIATVEAEIKDLDSLAKAAESLGLELVRGQTKFKWFGQFMGDYDEYESQLKAIGIEPKDYGKCDHVIRVPDAKGSTYEIGVVERDGRFYLLWDFFHGGYGLMQHVSADSDKKREGVGKLMQAYAREVTVKRMRRQGYRVTEKRGENGQIKLTCRR